MKDQNPLPEQNFDASKTSNKQTTTKKVYVQSSAIYKLNERSPASKKKYYLEEHEAKPLVE